MATVMIEPRRYKTTAYARGRQFELRVRKNLERNGWVVMRSPQSRGPFDLIALRRGSILLLQCKAGGGMGRADWNTLFDVADRAGAVCVFVTRLGRAISYNRMLAKKTAAVRRQPMRVIDITERWGNGAVTGTVDGCA